jgi:hypothetical protein
MEKFTISIPNIPNLVLKSERDLSFMGLKRLEWSTNLKSGALQSLQVIYTDGTESTEFGLKEKSSFRTFNF